MTSTVMADPVRSRARGTRRALVALEARRSLSAPWLWLGIAFTTWFSYNSAGATFAGGGYHGLIASFAGVASGLFVLGVGSGGRDHANGGPVAPDAAVDADERALGRLLGLWPAISVAVLFAAVVFAVQRVEGGMWIADLPRGGNDAVFSIVEMLQPAMLFTVAAAAGVAAGRASAHRAIVSVAGALAIAATGLIYWAWQWTPAAWVTLIQTQPIEVRLAADFVPADAPTTWMLSGPDQYQSSWGRVMVHQAMAGWHLVYLAGLAAVFAGLAVRGRRGRAAIAAGLAVAVVAVIAQLVVTPSGLAGA
jgi:hypothetical protein